MFACNLGTLLAQFVGEMWYQPFQGVWYSGIVPWSKSKITDWYITFDRWFSYVTGWFAASMLKFSDYWWFVEDHMVRIHVRTLRFTQVPRKISGMWIVSPFKSASENAFWCQAWMILQAANIQHDLANPATKRETLRPWWCCSSHFGTALPSLARAEQQRRQQRKQAALALKRLEAAAEKQVQEQLCASKKNRHVTPHLDLQEAEKRNQKRAQTKRKLRKWRKEKAGAIHSKQVKTRSGFAPIKISTLFTSYPGGYWSDRGCLSYWVQLSLMLTKWQTSLMSVLSGIFGNLFSSATLLSSWDAASIVAVMVKSGQHAAPLRAFSKFCVGGTFWLGTSAAVHCPFVSGPAMLPHPGQIYHLEEAYCKLCISAKNARDIARRQHQRSPKGLSPKRKRQPKRKKRTMHSELLFLWYFEPRIRLKVISGQIWDILMGIGSNPAVGLGDPESLWPYPPVWVGSQVTPWPHQNTSHQISEPLFSRGRLWPYPGLLVTFPINFVWQVGNIIFLILVWQVHYFGCIKLMSRLEPCPGLLVTLPISFSMAGAIFPMVRNLGSILFGDFAWRAKSGKTPRSDLHAE